MSDWSMALGEWNRTDVVCFDFSMAFGKVVLSRKIADKYLNGMCTSQNQIWPKSYQPIGFTWIGLRTSTLRSPLHLMCASKAVLPQLLFLPSRGRKLVALWLDQEAILTWPLTLSKSVFYILHFPHPVVRVGKAWNLGFIITRNLSARKHCSLLARIANNPVYVLFCVLNILESRFHNYKCFVSFHLCLKTLRETNPRVGNNDLQSKKYIDLFESITAVSPENLWWDVSYSLIPNSPQRSILLGKWK